MFKERHPLTVNTAIVIFTTSRTKFPLVYNKSGCYYHMPNMPKAWEGSLTLFFDCHLVKKTDQVLWLRGSERSLTISE